MFHIKQYRTFFNKSYSFFNFICHFYYNLFKTINFIHENRFNIQTHNEQIQLQGITIAMNMRLNIKSKYIIQCNDKHSININILKIKCRLCVHRLEFTTDYRSGKRK